LKCAAMRKLVRFVLQAFYFSKHIWGTWCSSNATNPRKVTHMQCVAVCCSVLQRAEVCCSELQYVAVCCSVLQCVAVCCELQCVAVFCCVLHFSGHYQRYFAGRVVGDLTPAVWVLQRVAVRRSALQCVTVVRCSALQCVAVHGSAWQCVAVRCSALQCVAVRCSASLCVAVRHCALQCVAICCNMLLCDAVRCSALQCVTVRCSASQEYVTGCCYLAGRVECDFTPSVSIERGITDTAPPPPSSLSLHSAHLFVTCVRVCVCV